MLAAFSVVATAMWAKQNSASFPTFVSLTAVVGAILFGIWLTDMARALRHFETKIVFASIYIALSVFAVAVAGFVLWQIEAEWTATRQQEADARAEKEKAGKAEIADCEAQKKDLLSRLRRQRTEAETVLEACAADFRATRTIFTSQTVEERCRVQQTALDAVIRQQKLANAKQCNPDEKKQSARR